MTGLGIEIRTGVRIGAETGFGDLRRDYEHRMGFCGNSDIRVWERGDRDEIRREVLRKLWAAKGGGYIFQSDHCAGSLSTIVGSLIDVQKSVNSRLDV